jgi:prevent-host-death family protein
LLSQSRHCERSEAILKGLLIKQDKLRHKMHRILSSVLKESAMGFAASDVVPFTQARANLSELADQAKAGAEKIITKNGESYVALIDSDRLDYYHRLERERIHLLLIDDAKRGLADIAAGRTQEADAALAQIQQRRKANPPNTVK